MEELSKMLRGKIIDGLESEKQDLVNDAIFNGEPMELLQDRCYVTDEGGFSNDRPAEFCTSCNLCIDIAGKPKRRELW